MPKLIITCGISASGKSTYAKTLTEKDWREINRDDIRFNLYCGGIRDWGLYKFNKEREAEVSFACDQNFELFSAYKRDIVVSNTNLDIKYHKYWKNKADIAGYEFEVKYFPITLEEALKRDERRSNSVGREVIIKQWQQWLGITNKTRHIPSEHKPKALWIDIDGTIATVNGRSHYDYGKVIKDKPRLDIISMITSWAERDNLEIVFMSGRDSCCREDTLKWLRQYFDEVPYLYMREAGDIRNDKIIKEELYWKHLAPNFDIVAAIDDRPRVIKMLHDLGIPTVISVQIGYEEF